MSQDFWFSYQDVSGTPEVCTLNTNQLDPRGERARVDRNQPGLYFNSDVLTKTTGDMWTLRYHRLVLYSG